MRLIVFFTFLATICIIEFRLLSIQFMPAVHYSCEILLWTLGSIFNARRRESFFVFLYDSLENANTVSKKSKSEGKRDATLIKFYSKNIFPFHRHPVCSSGDIFYKRGKTMFPHNSYWICSANFVFLGSGMVLLQSIKYKLF